jgi:sodium/hydrogen antiporter
VFYLYVGLEFLGLIRVDGEIREDAQRLQDVMTVVVWFLAISSIVRSSMPRFCSYLSANENQVVHGLTIPLGKLGFYLPRTISNAFDSVSRDELAPSFSVSGRSVERIGQLHERREQQIRAGQRSSDGTPTRPVFRIGGSIIRSRENQSRTPASISRISSITNNDNRPAFVQDGISHDSDARD